MLLLCGAPAWSQSPDPPPDNLPVAEEGAADPADQADSEATTDSGPPAESAGDPPAAEPAEELPAEQPAAKPVPPTPALPTSARELLAVHGVDHNYLDNLVDGFPPNELETDILLRVMFWVRRDFTPIDVEAWASPLNLPELIRQPEQGRGELFRLAGRITKIEPLQPTAKQAERFEMGTYYRGTLLIDGKTAALVYTTKVPRAWRKGGTFDARASAFGLFLKFAGTENDRPLPVFVAPRIAWHPDNLLGRLGMDVGLLDEPVDRQRFGDRDRECFYQLLAAVDRAEPGQLTREADRLLADEPKNLKRADGDANSVVPLFNDAANQRGRLVVLEGTARRVVRIRVEDPDIVARFGIDHYYEMGVFTDESAQSLENPVVFCVRRLPEGMPTGDGPNYGEHVRVAGFFMKTWRYRIDSAAYGSDDASGRSPWHLAPLLVGREPIWYPADNSTSPLAGAIAGGLFLVLIVTIWLALWRFNRADREFHNRTIAKAHAMDSGISLNELGLTGEGTPDFSGLAEADRGPEADRDTKAKES